MKFNINKSKLYELFLFMVLFLYIYKPIFFNTSRYITFILFPVTIIFISFFFFRKKLFSYLRAKSILQTSIGFFILFFYTFIIDYSSSLQSYVKFGLLNSSNTIRIYFSIFVSSIAIYLMFKHIGKENINELIKYFFWISFVQFLICLLMLINSNFREFINFRILSPDSKIIDTVHYNIRLFGITSEHLFGMPLFQALIFCCAMWFSIRRSYLYLFFAVTSLLPILINARIGIMLAPPSFLISFLIIENPIKLFLLFRTKSIIKFFINLLCVILITYFAWQIVKLLPDLFQKWILRGFEDIFEFFNSVFTPGTDNLSDKSIMAVLSGGFTKLPNTLGEIIFGDIKNYLPNNDVGYVKMINSGGIVYLFIAFLVVSWFLISSFLKSQDTCVRGILLSTLPILYISNIKGYIFGDNSFFRGVFLIAVFTTLNYYDLSKRKRLGN